MDRNDKFRMQLERRLNKSSKKEHIYRADNFEPSAYVDFIMERIKVDAPADVKKYIMGMPDNPDFSIIFGKSSALTLAQKTKVSDEFSKRILALTEFDTTTYVNELSELIKIGGLKQFKQLDEDGEYYYDFNPYLAPYNLTREQKEAVTSAFMKNQKEETFKTTRKLIIPLIICAALVLIPPFFIPNQLQHIGWLPADAGWFFKIIIGIISTIVLFFIVRILFFSIKGFILRKEKLI